LKAAGTFMWQINHALGKQAYWSDCRKLCIGVHQSADGWTDGSSFITINRDFLAKLQLHQECGWNELGLLIAHEMCHSAPDSDAHTHTPVFYEEYHDLSVKMPAISRRAFEQYRLIVCRTKKKKPRTVVDRIHKEAEMLAILLQESQTEESRKKLLELSLPPYELHTDTSRLQPA
jgi:hypothetical protein